MQITVTLETIQTEPLDVKALDHGLSYRLAVQLRARGYDAIV